MTYSVLLAHTVWQQCLASCLARATLSALVVMDVHARDVVAQLAAEGIEGQPQHFSWLSQLRMYWDDPSKEAESQEKTIIVRMMNAQVTPEKGERVVDTLA